MRPRATARGDVMLTALSIRDIVLVDVLDLEVEGGLTVLTGETGAGKSIILDALGLALGARGDAGLVRAGAKQASATAVFTAPDDPALIEMIADKGFEVAPGEDLILRRIVGADGRSRAFINDQPAGVTALREIGQALVGRRQDERFCRSDHHCRQAVVLQVEAVERRDAERARRRGGRHDDLKVSI